MTKKWLEAIAQVSFGISIALVLWVWLWPKPYALAIGVAAVLPWIAVALVLRFPSALSLGLRGRSVRGSLDGLFIPPCLVLAARALLDFSFLDVSQLAFVTVAAAAVLIVLLTRLLPSQPTHWSEWAVLVLALVSYCYGAIAQLDTLFDPAPAQTYRTTVARKYISHGKSWTYHLDLAPWGPDHAGTGPRVSGDLYADVKPGSQVCIALHPGLVGLRWYDVSLC